MRVYIILANMMKSSARLEAEREDISNRKLEAIKVFENDTKQVITDEITGRRQPKIERT